MQSVENAECVENAEWVGSNMQSVENEEVWKMRSVAVCGACGKRGVCGKCGV